MNYSPCEYGEENGEYGRLECAEGMEPVVVKLLPALRVPEEKELKKKTNQHQRYTTVSIKVVPHKHKSEHNNADWYYVNYG